MVCFVFQFGIDWSVGCLLGVKRFGSMVQCFSNTSLIMRKICFHRAFLLLCFSVVILFQIVFSYYCNCLNSTKLFFPLCFVLYVLSVLFHRPPWSSSHNSYYLSNPPSIITIIIFLEWHKKNTICLCFSVPAQTSQR